MSMTRSKRHDFQVPNVAIHYFRQSATDMSTTRLKQQDFHVPDVAKQVFRELTTQSDDRSTYHLEFRLNNLLRWHGWVMKFGYTRLCWSCDEVGVVLRRRFQNTDEGSCANHTSESIQKRELEVRRCQQREVTSTPRQLLRNLNTRFYVCMYSSLYVHAC